MVSWIQHTLNSSLAELQNKRDPIQLELLKFTDPINNLQIINTLLEIPKYCRDL